MATPLRSGLGSASFSFPSFSFPSAFSASTTTTTTAPSIAVAPTSSRAHSPSQTRTPRRRPPLFPSSGSPRPSPSVALFWSSVSSSAPASISPGMKVPSFPTSPGRTSSPSVPAATPSSTTTSSSSTSTLTSSKTRSSRIQRQEALSGKRTRRNQVHASPEPDRSSKMRATLDGDPLKTIRRDLLLWAQRARETLLHLRVVEDLGLLDYMCHIHPAFDDLASNSPFEGIRDRLHQLKVKVRGSPQEMDKEYLARLEKMADQFTNPTDTDLTVFLLEQQAIQQPETPKDPQLPMKPEPEATATKEARKDVEKKERKKTEKKLTEKKETEKREEETERTQKDATTNSDDEPVPAPAAAPPPSTQASKHRQARTTLNSSSNGEENAEKGKEDADWKKRQRLEKEQRRKEQEDYSERWRRHREQMEREAEEDQRSCAEELERQRQERFRREDEEKARHRQAPPEFSTKEQFTRPTERPRPKFRGLETDDTRWESFLASFGGHKGGRVCVEDVPWPTEPFRPPSLTKAAVSQYFKTLLLRWHPDKFNVYGSSIDDAVLRKVTEVAQKIIPQWILCTRNAKT